MTPGNQSEPETLPQVLDRLESRSATVSLPLQTEKPTIVMDRGIATKENIALLKKRGYPYCLVERRATETDYADEFSTARESFDGFVPRPDRPDEGVFLKKLLLPLPGDEAAEGASSPSDNPEIARLLVLSEAQKAKEEAMDTLKETRFLKELTAMRDRIAKSPAKQDAILRRLSRLEGRYPSVAKYYKILVHPMPPESPAPPAKPSRRRREKPPAPVRVDRIAWEKKPERETRKKTTGAYVIETTHTELSPSAIWSLYTSLTHVEDAFRSLKTDLGLRPVHHQTADRSRAHLFLSVLAYFLLSDIEARLQDKGDTRSWTRVREVLSTHVRQTVTGTDPHTRFLHETRLSSTPEPEQKALYKTLGVKNPLPEIKKRKALPTTVPLKNSLDLE